jgi:hypothetical protein
MVLKRYLWLLRITAAPWFLVVGATGSLAVFVTRFWSVISAGGLEPTSGLEGGGAFGIYLVCTKQILYHDFSAIPNGFIFNFLFYEVYGLLVRILGVCDATPLIGRLVTLSFLGLAAGVILVASRPGLERVESGVLALAVLSPVIGWWAFALRPDIAAIAFLGAALLSFVYYLERPRLSMILLSGGCLLCAWGFKQPYIFAAPVMLAYAFNRNHPVNAADAR